LCIAVAQTQVSILCHEPAKTFKFRILLI
jgi:hypothetical protein